MVLLNIVNDFGIRTSDDTIKSVTKRIESATGTDAAKRRAVKAMSRLHNNDPVYFKTYVRLFGKKNNTTRKSTKNELDRAKKVLGLLLRENVVTQNNVNLAYTRKSDENLPKRKSPKTQRALYDAYARLTRNGSVMVR